VRGNSFTSIDLYMSHLILVHESTSTVNTYQKNIAVMESPSSNGIGGVCQTCDVTFVIPHELHDHLVGCIARSIEANAKCTICELETI
jgi:hypothetical protein